MSSHTCTDEYSVEHSTLQMSGVLSLCNCPRSRILSEELPWCPWPLSFSCSPQGACWVLPAFSLSALQPGGHLSRQEAEAIRTHPVCFPPISCPVLYGLVSSVLKTVFHNFVPFWLFQAGGAIPVSVSWPEGEISICV